ncbi:MAG TPA: APC family permease [Bacillota bacterium]|nr:APC family permease [Bacillota bacterium]
MGDNGLKRQKVGIIGVVGMIYAMTAAGAYGIEDMVSASGPGMTIIMLLVLPLVWAFPIALASCELGSAIPDECGFYRWVQRALGEFWGFQIGWLKNIGIYINVAVFIVLATNYIASFAGLTNLQSYIVKVVLIVIFTWINLRGIKDVAIVSTIISGAILIAFAGITIIGFMHFSQNPFEPVVATGQTVVGSIGSSIAIGMWMYAGYESMSSLAGELENPQVIPKGIILALPLIIATYVLPTVSGVGSIGQWDSWGSDGVSYINVAMKYAPVFGVGFMLVAVISNLSMFNVYLASGARGFFVMAEDNLAPKILEKCDKKHGVPYVAILSLSIVSLILCMFHFDILVTIVSLFNMGLYSLIMISQIVLRRKEPELARPYKIRLGKVGTDIFCAIPVLVAFIALYINGTDYFVLGLIGMMTGPVAYIIFKRVYGGLYKNDPEKYPINHKTKLAVGDTKRIAIAFGLLSVLMIIGRLFLPGYDDPQYYADFYGRADIFGTFMNIVLIAGIACAIIAVIFASMYKKIDSAEKPQTN